MSNAAKIPLRAISENGTIRFPIANNPYTPTLRGGRHSSFVTDVTDVTAVTAVTAVTVENVISPENHFIGVVFDGESHGDLHFGSFCCPDTVLEQCARTFPPRPSPVWSVHRETIPPIFVYKIWV